METLTVTRGQNGRFTSVSSINRANASTEFVRSPFTAEDFENAADAFVSDTYAAQDVIKVLEPQLKSVADRVITLQHRKLQLELTDPEGALRRVFTMGVQLGLETAGQSSRIG